jgi:hypothetical protein
LQLQEEAVDDADEGVDDNSMTAFSEIFVHSGYFSSHLVYVYSIS